MMALKLFKKVARSNNRQVINFSKCKYAFV